MKKTLSLLLVLVMCFGLISGCSSNQTPTTSETPASEAPTTTETQAPPQDAPPADVPPAEEPGTDEPAPPVEPAPSFESPIEALHYTMDQRVSYNLPIANGEVFTAYVTASDRQELVSVNKDYWYEQVGISFEVTEVLNSVANEKFNLMIATGEYYDVLPMSASGYLGGVDKGVDEEILFNFEPYIEEYMPNYYMLLHCDETYESAAYSDGGFITNLILFYYAPYTSDYGNQIRLDMLEGVGMDMPETYDDWDKIFRAVKDEYQLESTFSISQSGVGRNNYWVAGYGIAGEVAVVPFINVPLYVEDDQVKFGATQEVYRDYLKMMATWYKDGILYQDFYSNTGWSPVASIINDSQCFCWQDDNFKIDEYQLSINDPSAVVWAAADPVLEAGSKKYLTTSIRYTEGGTSLSTTLQGKDWELFLTCMDYAYSEECDLLFSYGIESESYTLDANGKPVYTDLIINNPEGYTFNEARQLYGVGTYSGNITFSDASTYNKSDARYAADELWDRSDGEIGTMPSEVSLTQLEQESYTIITNDVVTYCAEAVLKFIVGEDDIFSDAAWQTYLGKIGTLKLDEALALMQGAYDRYLNKY